MIFNLGARSLATIFSRRRIGNKAAVGSLFSRFLDSYQWSIRNGRKKSKKYTWP